jgi:prepilin signal peptidase PulO-like enzyme (type II secretory pathway)
MQTFNGVKEVKKINKNSLAKIMALIYGFIGFFIALIVAISTMANIMMQTDFSGSVILVTLFNIGAGLLLGVLSSLVTALIGWVIGYIAAGVYNWFAGKMGGVKIELADADGAIETKPEEYIAETKNNLS